MQNSSQIHVISAIVNKRGHKRKHCYCTVCTNELNNKMPKMLLFYQLGCRCEHNIRQKCICKTCKQYIGAEKRKLVKLYSMLEQTGKIYLRGVRSLINLPLYTKTKKQGRILVEIVGKLQRSSSQPPCIVRTYNIQGS